jgi:AcrR family transcriptional regulator
MTATRPTGRRGRRPGAGSDTRDAILDAARTAFAGRGYRGTTIRAVAADAGVDAALVHHYFGTKDDLFLAALAIPVDPRVVLASAMEGGVEEAAERFLRVFLSVWDDPDLRLPLVGLARNAFDPDGRELFRALGVDRPEHRMPVVASQVIGLILMRYVLEVEPIASMPAEQVVATYAPTIQRYLTDDLP